MRGDFIFPCAPAFFPFPSSLSDEEDDLPDFGLPPILRPTFGIAGECRVGAEMDVVREGAEIEGGSVFGLAMCPSKVTSKPKKQERRGRMRRK
jgi:hypothetical protein